MAKVTAAQLNLGLQAALVATSETTTSTTYADLATTTDTVTVVVPPSGAVLVTLSSFMSDNTTNAFAWVSFAMSGANTVAAADVNGIMVQNNGGGVAWQLGAPITLTGLTPGSTTFKMKYRVQNGGGGSGTGTFSSRRIGVIPIG